MWRDKFFLNSFVIETDDDNPRVVAAITGDVINVAKGYKLKVRADSDALVSDGDDLVRKKREAFSDARFCVNAELAERRILQDQDVAKD